ncbi:MAG: branched-chain amino acid ABC transporter permease [Desulfatiglans sp.]|jgi:branched-chain amino acid transport system permease protein|nr:branched-chain amino acid ABC transporter permease [Thermodesulfobacteriota bacterium]MEE4353383.1 branched-chain amino acid ABC transporter permease [Desulfatiglans sp.]
MTLPAGVYAQTYDEDQALIRTRPQWYWFLALMIFIFILPLFGGGRILGIMNVIGITLIAVVGLQINAGYAGQINMGQSAFMGVGAYTAAALTVHFDLPIWITIPAGGISAAIFGSVFGLAAVRIKGFYLALTTIAAQFVFSFAMLKLPKSWFGQSEGLRLDPVSLFGLEFDTDMKMYYLIFSVTVLMIYGAWGLIRSRTGRALVAVRDNDNAAEIIGINVFYFKALSFFIGAFYAGVGGALWCYYVRYIQADQFTLWLSVWYLGMLIVGGMGSILGAIIGTVAIRFLQEMITYLGPQIADMQFLAGIGGEIIFASMNILLGGVIILFVIFEPRGLVHRWNIIKESYRIWPFPH